LFVLGVYVQITCIKEIMTIIIIIIIIIIIATIIMMMIITIISRNYRMQPYWALRTNFGKTWPRVPFLPT
jgi:hypothetical protein